MVPMFALAMAGTQLCRARKSITPLKRQTGRADGAGAGADGGAADDLKERGAEGKTEKGTVTVTVPF
jgi:hypothetical protein